MMLTVSSEKRANIADICSHMWVNDGYGDRYECLAWQCLVVDACDFV